MEDKTNNYIICGGCGNKLKFIRVNSLGQHLFKPCIWCGANKFAKGYQKAESIYKEGYQKNRRSEIERGKENC